MAAMLLLIAALATNEPAPVAPSDETVLFEAAASCTAYHIFTVSQLGPDNAAAQTGEDKATMFLMAAYAKQPEQNPEAAEARIEEIVKGLFNDVATVEPEQHKREMADLEKVCGEFEAAAISIVDAAGFSDEPK